MKLWKRFVCWWRGHTFALPDGKTDENGRFAGGRTLLAVIADSSCIRCGRSYVELWNEGNFR